jgi:hypothetical protein
VLRPMTTIDQPPSNPIFGVVLGHVRNYANSQGNTRAIPRLRRHGQSQGSWEFMGHPRRKAERVRGLPSGGGRTTHRTTLATRDGSGGTQRVLDALRVSH